MCQQLQFSLFSESTFPLWILRLWKGAWVMSQLPWPTVSLHCNTFTHLQPKSLHLRVYRTFFSLVTPPAPTESHYFHIYFGNIVYPLISCLVQSVFLLRLVPVNTLMCSRIRRLWTRWKNKQLHTESHLEGPVKHKENFGNSRCKFTL